MEYTRFGEYVRILRIKHHEVMGDMAKKLGVSVPYLSAVENGKKNPPDKWGTELTKLYNLSDDDADELAKAIEASKTQYKITIGSAGNIKRRAATEFARSFDNIDDETAEKIIRLLNKEKIDD